MYKPFLLKILTKVSRKLEKEEDVDLDVFERALDFVKTLADGCRHGKEEDRLFPLLEERGLPKRGGPINVMIQEHKQGRDYVRALS